MSLKVFVSPLMKTEGFCQNSFLYEGNVFFLVIKLVILWGFYDQYTCHTITNHYNKENSYNDLLMLCMYNSMYLLRYFEPTPAQPITLVLHTQKKTKFSRVGVSDFIVVLIILSILNNMHYNNTFSINSCGKVSCVHWTNLWIDFFWSRFPSSILTLIYHHF